METRKLETVGKNRKFVLKAKATMVGGLRLLPAAFLLASVITTAPAAGATGCAPARPANVIVNGGSSRNETNLDLSADGGEANANANGGDDNLAVAILGQAEAGNGGDADANANGGIIEIGNITTGNNTGNVVAVKQQARGGCWGAAKSGGNTIVNGGTSRNESNITISADGGEANANANGGDDNVAVGILGNAEAGNGGDADANANGGTIEVGDINTGGNVGNVVNVDNGGNFGGGGNVLINGGTSRTETNIDISADGGEANANANGGDDNVAVGILGNAAAGNGGDADANANGGTIEVGDINSGNNTGNVVNVDNSGGGNTNVNGGTSSNETNIDISADGGEANANANGGDDNTAVGVLGDAEAGNGGDADANANGGSVEVGDINSGGNTGNVVSVD